MYNFEFTNSINLCVHTIRPVASRIDIPARASILSACVSPKTPENQA